MLCVLRENNRVETEKAIAKIKCSKAAGEDGITLQKIKILRKHSVRMDVSDM